MNIQFRTGPSALPPDAFIELATRVWPRPYDRERVRAALERTLNVSAWQDDRLVGAVRVLTDGYLFNTIPEVMVDPAWQRRGIGRALMQRALAAAPGGRLFFGAQVGNERFFEKAGFRRGPIGFVGNAEDQPDTESV